MSETSPVDRQSWSLFAFMEVNGYELWECPACSAVVVGDDGRAAHAYWHEALTSHLMGDEPPMDEASIRAAERARIRSLLPYHVPCCGNFLASVGDLVNENEDSPGSTANCDNRQG